MTTSDLEACPPRWAGPARIASRRENLVLTLAPLPIDAFLSEIVDALRDKGAIVLSAPPATGKTTRVPPAVLDAGLCGEQGRVLVLQPRRVAARLAAARIASERGCEVGEEVGYRVRFDQRCGPRTRIEILTEGLLVRLLQADPFLEGVSCVILDEFHERSLHVDLALAMLREARAEARPDLRLVVMSATLDADPLIRFLGGPEACAHLRVKGRVHPVEIVHLQDPAPERRLDFVPRMSAVIRDALAASPDGHLLAFLPGAGEIEALRDRLEGVPANVLPLHGRLSSTEQDRALAPSGRRKVVLATNIAETSVTFEGVRVVVDGGLHRVPRLDASVGLEGLVLEEIPRDAAEQRAGRAGRTGPGRCIRLWSAARHALKPASGQAEIQRVDLASAMLQVLAWGSNPRNFPWFEAPPEANLARALQLLEMLGALDEDGLTALGRGLAALPAHPRFARVLLAGAERGMLDEAALAAALVAEADPFLESPPRGSVGGDLDWRVEALRAGGDRAGGFKVDRRRLARVIEAATQLRGLARVQALSHARPAPDYPLARLLLQGFPDRVALRRPGEEPRYQLASGLGARLSADSAVGNAPLILAVGVEAGKAGLHREHLIRSACALERSWLPTEERDSLRFETSSASVQHFSETRLGQLVLERRPKPGPPDPALASRLLEEAARISPETALAPDAPFLRLLARLRFLDLAREDGGLPAFWDPRELLPELCIGRRSFAELRAVDLTDLVLSSLQGPARARLDAWAPERVGLPSGVRVRIAYPGEDLDIFALFSPSAPRCAAEARAPGSPFTRPPVLAARVQHLFGLLEPPRLAGGRIAAQVHLLAPSGRVVHITQDLAGFWKSGWLDLRKELRGRYPRHAWPEDPTHPVEDPRTGRSRRS